jgi:UDP-2-acetamido-2,6-beta-L-arabino-hexul-4-ose reductase
MEEIPFPTDARGLVFEPLDGARLGQQQNVHVALTLPGAIRGNHFHQHSTEIAVVLGPGLVRLREGRTAREVPIPEGRAFRFTLPPGVSHAFKATGPTPMLIVAFSTAVFDAMNPDRTEDMLFTS